MRSRKTEKAYAKHKKLNGFKNGRQVKCPFCNLTHDEIVREFNEFRIIKNAFPSTAWDMQEVAEHLMLVPKRCMPSFKDFNSSERKEYFEIMADYESNHYNIYTRSDASVYKSVTHIHSHLIKNSGVKKNFLIFREKPRFMFFR